MSTSVTKLNEARAAEAMHAAKKKKRKSTRLTWRNYFAVLLLAAVLGAAFAMPSVSVYAQTPVPIIVDTNAIFTSTNTWIEVFVPIMAIGIGISVALAILTFIGNQILRAFRGGGR